MGAFYTEGVVELKAEPPTSVLGGIALRSQVAYGSALISQTSFACILAWFLSGFDGFVVPVRAVIPNLLCLLKSLGGALKKILVSGPIPNQLD